MASCDLLRGKVALITGAARGIGRGIAQSLAEWGARIVIHYRSSEEEAHHTLRSLPGEGHFVLKGDVTDPDYCKQLVEHTVQRAGKLDILVNNAGIYEALPFSEPDYARWQQEWRRMFDTNFFSAVNIAYHAVRVMRQQGSGKIIFIASRAGLRGEQQHSHYAASKAALVVLARSMAVELAKENIQVYAVAPGWVGTELAQETLKRRGAEIVAQIPVGRVADPLDVGRAVRFLASPDADYLTGITLDVNGASYIR
ncbi:MAG: SDR family oxidoreductase [Armatimonadota bacterium]|nr:SDR family oxidoreductase [bacterium]MDW8320424.1 SDR family oxidoreductase [Armatimonadota bacterium]